MPSDFAVPRLWPEVGVPDEDGIPFGGHKLVRKIAVGGMAEVYLALRCGEFGFRRHEVIKVLLPRLAKHQDFVDMFIREAVLAAEFRHPNLVQIYDVGRESDLYYIDMEFVDGVDLMRLVRRCRTTGKPLSLDFVLAVVAQVAEALTAVHEATSADGRPLDIVHRDVTPQNLMVGFDGQVKVVDFGVAQSLLAEAHAEQALLGKGPYMAPEQWTADAVDRRADIFALGVVLYELTVGRRLFKRTSPEATKKAILSGDIPRPSRVRPGFPPELEEVILHCLALDPRDRYPTTRAMRLAIEEVQFGLGGALHRDEMAQWLDELFAGTDRNDLWPKLDLTAPGQLSEADEALRRATMKLPLFNDDESSSGLAITELSNRRKQARRGDEGGHASHGALLGAAAAGALVGAGLMGLLWALL